MQTYSTDSKQQLILMWVLLHTQKWDFFIFWHKSLHIFHLKPTQWATFISRAFPVGPTDLTSFVVIQTALRYTIRKEECKLDWNSMTCAPKLENSDKGRTALLESQQCLQSSSVVLLYCQMQSHIGAFIGISSERGVFHDLYQTVLWNKCVLLCGFLVVF